MPSAKPQILIVGALVWANAEVDSLKGDYHVLVLDSPDRATFVNELKTGKYSQISAIYRHNSSASAVGVFDEELIQAMPESLAYICHNGAGYDQIDIAACTAKGIKVSNTPQAVDDATATVGMFLIISALRNFYQAQVSARAGTFDKGLAPAHDPEHKVLGIVGMGGIGRALAKRALGFDMKVQYYNRNPVSPSILSAFPDGAITYVDSLEQLLATSHVVSLNLPLNAQTRGSFGRKQFAAMKRGACLVNTARGGVVDEEAMLEALESGQLGTAGLDVFPNEPEINPRLLANDKITVLPHQGTFTEESQKAMECKALDNIVSALTSGKLITPVWEQEGKL